MTYNISIALAVRNGTNFMQAQFDSFLRQTRLPNELIISDDASTDNTVEIAENFARKAPFNVHIYKNNKCLGVTKNFENALSKCSGDIIFLTDHDDVWLPDKIDLMTAYFTRCPEVGAIFSDAIMCDETLADLGYNLWQALWFKPCLQQKVLSGKAFEVFLKYPMVAGMTMAYKSNFHDMLLPFPNYKSCHDIWIILLIAAISKVTIIDKPLAKHRVHTSNQSGMTLKNLYKQYLKAKHQIKENRLNDVLGFHKAVLQRLDKHWNHFQIAPDVKYHLHQKIEHSQNRANMPENLMKRFPIIFNELIGLRYRKYSYGYKSLLQDVFLR